MPPYQEVTVVMTDGTKFTTRSTMLSKGGEERILRLDVDPKTHPAWIGRGNTANQRSSKGKKFNDKYSMNFVDVAETK
ncbi:MAG: 50S ribosomal protein L31 [Proteobacteria bacterium]|nr:50S ribosomal protein L31 [Pseudomonadota bacterium]